MVMEMSLERLRERNAYVMQEFLTQDREGLNLDAHVASEACRKLTSTGKGKSFCLKSSNDAWEQSYQFIDLATVNAEVLKVSYHIDVTVQIKSNFGLST